MAPPSYTIRMLRERDVIRDYLNEVATFLGQQGSQSLATIGASCKKPPSVDQSLGDLFYAHSHRFELVRAGNSTVVKLKKESAWGISSESGVSNPRDYLMKDKGRKIEYIRTTEGTARVFRQDPHLRGQHSALPNKDFIALLFRGDNLDLGVLAIETASACYIFDCVELDSRVIFRQLKCVLACREIVKMVFDAHKLTKALRDIGEHQVDCFRSIFDVQLAYEFHSKKMCGVHGFYLMLRTLELQFPPDLVGLEEVIEDCSPAWGEGPLPTIGVEFAAKCAQYLLSSGKALWNDFDQATTSIVQDIYNNSAKESLEFGEYRLFSFDKDHEYCLVDKSLLSATRPDDMFPEETYSIASDIESLLNILPEKLQEMMVKLKIDMDALSDIVLDLGRKPQCWVAGSRVLLCEPQTPDDVVTAATISEVLQKCGSFGSDHRAVLDGRLHRISALHNREDAVVGLTFRVARCIQGTVGSFIDILLGSEHSILIMGEPGSGKTTVIREISRILSEQKNVFVVDTSNEIAGGGAVPHHCIGMSRRIMVPTLDAQCTAMVECVQNHTPYVMVIDEIGRTKEVAAAESVKQRGVRMVASAHGNLRSLVRNRALRGLVGNLETVIIGDTVAAVMAAGAPSKQEEYDDESSSSGGTLRKTCIQRASEPIFDIIVEMERGMYHEVRVIRNVARAVDEILLGRKFEVEHRRRSKDGTDPRISYSMA